VIALFPGRYDRLHIGHIITMQRLAKVYGKVVVVVFGYDGEKYSLSYRYQLLKECLGECRGNFEVKFNESDWRESRKVLTPEDVKLFMKNYTFDVYCTGNHKYLKTAEDAGYKVHYVERAYDYSATDDRAIQNIKSILNVG